MQTNNSGTPPSNNPRQGLLGVLIVCRRMLRASGAHRKTPKVDCYLLEVVEVGGDPLDEGRHLRRRGGDLLDVLQQRRHLVGAVRLVRRGPVAQRVPVLN